MDVGVYSFRDSTQRKSADIQKKRDNFGVDTARHHTTPCELPQPFDTRDFFDAMRQRKLGILTSQRLANLPEKSQNVRNPLENYPQNRVGKSRPSGGFFHHFVVDLLC
jgi:hypothetical protein